MNLSKNFTLGELKTTQTGLENEPNKEAIQNLFLLCNFVLQPIRDRFGATVINSGYRSTAVNAKVGGAKSSEHLTGCAADFVVKHGFTQDYVFKWCRDNLLFGQIINETNNQDRWIHISLPRFHMINNDVWGNHNGEYKQL